MQNRLSDSVLKNLDQSNYPSLETSIRGFLDAVTLGDGYQHLSALVLGAACQGLSFFDDEDRRRSYVHPRLLQVSKFNWKQGDLASAGLNHVLSTKGRGTKREMLYLASLHLRSMTWVFDVAHDAAVRTKLFDLTMPIQQTFEPTTCIKAVPGAENLRETIEHIVFEENRLAVMTSPLR